MNKASKYFEAFKESINSVWGRKLCVEFFKHSERVKRILGEPLNAPVFRFNHSRTQLGSWNAAEKILTISYYLLDNYEWDVVSYVLRHEMAHMIVSEVWGDIGDNGRAHGELFAKACDILEISAERVFDPSRDFADKEKLVSRVQKLFALGESNFKEEADLAVKKAYELMAKHNISAMNMADLERKFVARPVGEIYLRVPYYIKRLAGLVKKNYFVECILSNHLANGKYYTFVEFFGEPHNVDVAEYVYHFLLLEGERQWSSFRRCVDTRRYTKSAFLEGFYAGFAESLNKERVSVMSVVDPENTLPIGIQDPLLKEKYRSHYPLTQKTRSKSTTTKQGKMAGFERGRAVKIRQGVTSDGSSGGLLT